MILKPPKGLVNSKYTVALKDLYFPSYNNIKVAWLLLQRNTWNCGVGQLHLSNRDDVDFKQMV